MRRLGPLIKLALFFFSVGGPAAHKMRRTDKVIQIMKMLALQRQLLPLGKGGMRYVFCMAPCLDDPTQWIKHSTVCEQELY